MKRCAGHRGFSVVELILVVAILAMLGALVVPQIGSAGSGYRADAAARRIAADLNYARGQARLTSTAHSIEFDAAANRYTFADLNHPDRSSAKYAVSLARPPYEVTLKGADFEGATTLTYSAFGLPSAGGEVEIRCGSAARVVEVDGTTGEARIR